MQLWCNPFFLLYSMFKLAYTTTQYCYFFNHARRHVSSSFYNSYGTIQKFQNRDKICANSKLLSQKTAAHENFVKTLLSRKIISTTFRQCENCENLLLSFRKKIVKLFSRNIFQVRVNFSFFHTVHMWSSIQNEKRSLLLTAES